MYFNIIESVGIFILIILVLEFSKVLFMNKNHRGIKSLFLSFLIIISFLIIDRATEATLNYESTIIINCEMFTVFFLTYILELLRARIKMRINGFYP